MKPSKPPVERVVYPPQDPMALEPYFSRHMLAVTAEDLHSKAEIAEQLAWRDKQIAELELVAELNLQAALDVTGCEYCTCESCNTERE